MSAIAPRSLFSSVRKLERVAGRIEAEALAEYLAEGGLSAEAGAVTGGDTADIELPELFQGALQARLVGCDQMGAADHRGKGMPCNSTVAQVEGLWSKGRRPGTDQVCQPCS